MQEKHDMLFGIVLGVATSVVAVVALLGPSQPPKTAPPGRAEYSLQWFFVGESFDGPTVYNENGVLIDYSSRAEGRYCSVDMMENAIICAPALTLDGGSIP